MIRNTYMSYFCTQVIVLDAFSINIYMKEFTQCAVTTCPSYGVSCYRRDAIFKPLYLKKYLNQKIFSSL